MRNTKVVSISLPAEMLTEAEALAKEENRTMSELVREALRSYKREREGWRDVLEFRRAARQDLSEAPATSAVKALSVRPPKRR